MTGAGAIGLTAAAAAAGLINAVAGGACCSDGVALVDDISRCWLRGRKEVEAYHLKTLAATETMKSQLADIQCHQQAETAWITAPTTAVSVLASKTWRPLAVSMKVNWTLV